MEKCASFFFLYFIKTTFGNLGNWLYIIPSVYYLAFSKSLTVRKSLHKSFFIFCDVYVISILLGIFGLVILQPVNLNYQILKRIVMPLTSYDLWFCWGYCVFIVFISLFNKIENKISKKIHLVICIIASICFFLSFVFGIRENTTIWLLSCFIISYFKKYNEDLMNSLILNVIVFIVTLFLYLSLIFLTATVFASEFLEHNFPLDNLSSPLLFICVLSLFNIVRIHSFHSSFINYISSLSLFCYIIHEFVLTRVYFRPYILKMIYESFGYDNILIFIFVLTFATYVICVLFSSLIMLFRNSINKVILSY